MISFMISVVPPKIDWTRLSRRAHNRAGEQRNCAPAGQAGLPLVSASRGVRAVRAGRRSRARGSSRRVAAPRAAAWPPTTTPNQRPRISQPSVRTSTPVSSSRHSCHRSSRCTMPATAARCGRAPASRRAAIRTSAGVSTLTTTAWARPAPDGHRDSETVVRSPAVTPSTRESGSGQLLAASPASGRARPAGAAARTGCVPGRSPPRPGRAGPTGPAG